MNAIAFTREERALARASRRMAANTILRDAAKWPLLTRERSAFVPGMTVPVCPDLRRTAEVPIPQRKIPPCGGTFLLSPGPATELAILVGVILVGVILIGVLSLTVRILLLLAGLLAAALLLTGFLARILVLLAGLVLIGHL
jgi:hypothetical protein